jgi:hypothetical protein
MSNETPSEDTLEAQTSKFNTIAAGTSCCAAATVVSTGLAILAPSGSLPLIFAAAAATAGAVYGVFDGAKTYLQMQRLLQKQQAKPANTHS